MEDNARMMRFMLVFISLMGLARAYVQQDTCCLCFPSKEDPSTFKECKRWLSENKRNCGYSETLDHFMGYKLNESLRCEKVNIWGAYHGFSYRYIHTFKIINDAAKTFDPGEVKFDGSTCLIFNNTDKVKENAELLMREFPQVKFDLSGNQNNGVVFNNPLLGPTEIESFSSKMFVKIENRGVNVTYGACTKPGKYCDYVTKDVGANNPSNSKFCTLDNRVVSQSCCNPDSRGYGRWAAPGKSCKK